MTELLISSLVISGLHAIIPNHWLPILAIGNKQKWHLPKILQVTFLAAVAHATSTILIGILLSILGEILGYQLASTMKVISSVILVGMGIFFILQHHRHKHFDVEATFKLVKTDRKIISSLLLAMFLSPCLEIAGIYFAAGYVGWTAVLSISAIFFICTVGGMIIWVTLGYHGLKKWDWHRLEHDAGIITGTVLIFTGILFYLL